MTTKLQAIFAAAVESLRINLADAEDDIAKQIMETVEQAQDNEISAKFKCSFAMTYKMDSNVLEFDLSYGMRKHWPSTQEVPDPNQPKLALDVDSVQAREN